MKFSIKRACKNHYFIRLFFMIPIMCLIVLLFLFCIYSFRPKEASYTGGYTYIDAINGKRKNERADLYAALSCEVCWLTKGFYQIECDGLTVDGVDLPGYWINVNDTQMTFSSKEALLNAQFDTHITKYHTVLNNHTVDYSSSKPFVKSHGNRLLLACGEELWGSGDNEQTPIEFSNAELSISSAQNIHIFPYRFNYFGVDLSQQNIFVDGEYFNPYAVVVDDPKNVVITNGESTIPVDFNTVITAESIHIKYSHRTITTALEIAGIQNGTVDLTGVSDISFVGNGDIGIYYTSEKNEYQSCYQKNEIISDRNFHFDFIYIDGKITKGTAFGKAQDIRLAEHGVFPFVSFRDWLYNDIYIAPISVLVVISISISLTNHLDEKRKLT